MDRGYVNSRVKGMRSILLDPRGYESLIVTPDIKGVITQLEKTPYKREIEEASVLYSGIRCVETALRKNLIRTSQKILSLVKGEPAESYVNIFLGKWDVQNIKTILRGKKIHVPNDEILECLVPAGELDEVTLSELLKQPDLKSVIDMLATWEISYARPLTDHYEEYYKNRDPVILEYALDRFYYTSALESVQSKSYDHRVIREILTTEIDFTNIKSVLRMIRDRIESEEGEKVLIEGGRSLSREKLLHMLNTQSIRDAIRVLDATPYHQLSKIAEQSTQPDTISPFEKEFDRYLIRKYSRLFRGDPLSSTIIIGYLWAKFTEIMNIRIIARCKGGLITDEELEAELVYV